MKQGEASARTGEPDRIFCLPIEQSRRAARATDAGSHTDDVISPDYPGAVRSAMPDTGALHVSDQKRRCISVIARLFRAR